MQRGLSATYPAPISTIMKQKAWIGVGMRAPLKNFLISAQGFPPPQNS